MSIALEERRSLIERELTAFETTNSNARHKIVFRGQEHYLPVINVNPQSLLLNPNNNRLSGQLLDHPNQKEVLADPTSSASQTILHKLLSQTDQFKDLKEQLKVLGQQEPGLITRDGLLVNGNTRVAALTELGINHVSVAVLPPNVIETDIFEIEMSLQVSNLVHQDYSFTNELLLMKRFINEGGSTKDLAKKMGWIRRGETKVNQRLRLLGYIEEVRRLKNPPILFSVFDAKEQHLKDLDADYQRLKNEGDIQAAEDLKWSRLASIFMGLNKDQVRAIDEDFVAVNLAERLANTEPEVRDFLENYRKRPISGGFAELLGDDEEDNSNFDMQKFLSDLLTDDPEISGEGMDGDEKFAKVGFAARRVADQIIDDQKNDNLKAEPNYILEEARVKISNLRATLPEVINEKGFKKGKFEFNLKKLKDEIDKLESSI